MWCNRIDISPHIDKRAAFVSLNLKYMRNRTIQIQICILFNDVVKCGGGGGGGGGFIMLILHMHIIF